MSGPGGSTTKRDQRREGRRSQLQQRQLERQRETRRRIRNQRIRRYSIVGVSVIIIALLAFLVIHANAGTGGSGSHSSNAPIVRGTGTYTTPANGSARDGMTCLTTEGAVEHIHMYLAIYVNGQQVQVPAGTGIVGNQCLYALHVHGDPGDNNIIHEESPNNDIYTLVAFFDIWGQPLSKTQVMQYRADATHQLQFVTFDGSGHKTVYTGNPLDIQFTAHQTIYILYNSPNVQPKPFTNFLPGE